MSRPMLSRGIWPESMSTGDDAEYAVLSELLGYKDRDIDDLVQAGVIEAP